MNGPTFATTSGPAPARPTPPPALVRPNLAARPQLGKPREVSGNRVLTYLRLHWLTILFLGSLLGAGLAYAAWVLVQPNYESYALFRVASAPPSVSATADASRGRTDFNTYLKTTASLFKTQFVYTAALRELRHNATLSAQKDPIKFLDKEIQVETKEGLEVLRLSMKGTNPDDVKAIVDAMRTAYMTEVVQKEFELLAARKQGYEEQRQRLEGEINRKAKSQLGGAGEMGVGTLREKMPLRDGAPMAMPEVTGAAPPVAEPEHVKRARFPKLMEKEEKLRGEIPAIDFRIARLRAGMENAKATAQKRLQEPPGADVVELAKKDEAYLRAKFTADQRNADYQRRSAVAKEPNSPTMIALKQSAESAQEEADAILAARAKTIETERRKPMTADLEEKLTLAEMEIEQLGQQKVKALADLARLEKDIRESLPPPAGPLPPAAQAKGPPADPALTDILTTDKMYEQVTSHVIATDLELKGPRRVTEIQSASVPMVVDAKKQILATVVAGILGFVVVAGVCVLAEMRTKKVSSLSELRGSLPTPVVGVVPWLPDGTTARDPLKRADVNEAIDKLRAYVVQTWLSKGASTVTVTSALGDEGKSFTAFGIASSLAQAGYKTLLVDFDLRNPSLHPYAGVPNTGGVCELLRGEADFRKTIQILPNGLHFLAAGKWSDEARQAAVGGRLEALLNRLKEPFDCVVLHGHALLTVAESVEVARRSDVVLLCALYRESRGPMVQRASERIASMEIPFAGIVYLGATPNEALC